MVCAVKMIAKPVKKQITHNALAAKYFTIIN